VDRKERIMPAPKKREARKLMGQPAWITLDGGFAARQCMVQDISRTGAKISLDEAATLPATLRLAFARDARTGHKCQVVWRRGRSAGVKFVR
jgi:PilZ domain